MKVHIVFCISSLIFGLICMFLSITDPIIMNRFALGLATFCCGVIFGDSFMSIFESFLRREYVDRRKKD